MMENKINECRQLIENSDRIVFFGGAGVSTASGIPDFRSSEGVFVKQQQLDYSPEEIVSQSFFNRHPDKFFSFYFENLVHREAKPNIAHYFAKALETLGKNVIVVTQNIDGLHQKAGSRHVIELHGSVWRNQCTQCGKMHKLESLQRDTKGIPVCPEDQGIVKPDVVLYGEQLDSQLLNDATAAISYADLLIIAGTSLSVYPASELIKFYKGKAIIVVNESEIHVNHRKVLYLNQDMTDVFAKLLIMLQNPEITYYD